MSQIIWLVHPHSTVMFYNMIKWVIGLDTFNESATEFAAQMDAICPDKSERFVPKKSSCLCSAHFNDSCFEHKPLSLMDATGEPIELKKRLMKGSVPTRTDVVLYISFD